MRGLQFSSSPCDCDFWPPSAVAVGKPACVPSPAEEILIPNAQAYVDIMRELSSMQSLRIHPNIVTFIGVCVEDPTKPILVEEYIRGKTLRRIMDVGCILSSFALACHGCCRCCCRRLGLES